MHNIHIFKQIKIIVLLYRGRGVVWGYIKHVFMQIKSIVLLYRGRGDVIKVSLMLMSKRGHTLK